MSEHAIAGYRSDAILALGGDRDLVMAALMEPVAGIYRLIDWEILPRQAMNGTSYQLPERLVQACRQLGKRVGRPLWRRDGRGPYLHDQEPALGLALDQVVAVADPLPPLRAWVGGLSVGESLAAAQEALTGAFCQPVALYRMSPYEDKQRLAGELAAVDVVIVTGGFDRMELAARRPVLLLCERVARAVEQLPLDRRPLLCFAGNRWAASAALDVWREISGIEAEAVLNVAPGPGRIHTSSLAVSLSQHYWKHSTAELVLRQLGQWITPPSVLRSLHWSFAQAVRTWREIYNLQELHALHCGPRQWMHVWATADDVGVRVRFTSPQSRPEALDQWPDLQLVSGPWPDSHWAKPERHWCEPLGLLPVVANVGQVNPDAALQVMVHDLFRPQ